MSHKVKSLSRARLKEILELGWQLRRLDRAKLPKNTSTPVNRFNQYTNERQHKGQGWTELMSMLGIDPDLFDKLTDQIDKYGLDLKIASLAAINQLKGESQLQKAVLEVIKIKDGKADKMVDAMVSVAEEGILAGLDALKVTKPLVFALKGAMTLAKAKKKYEEDLKAALAKQAETEKVEGFFTSLHDRFLDGLDCYMFSGSAWLHETAIYCAIRKIKKAQFRNRKAKNMSKVTLPAPILQIGMREYLVSEKIDQKMDKAFRDLQEAAVDLAESRQQSSVLEVHLDVSEFSVLKHRVATKFPKTATREFKDDLIKAWRPKLEKALAKALKNNKKSGGGGGHGPGGGGAGGGRGGRPS